MLIHGARKVAAKKDNLFGRLQYFCQAKPSLITPWIVVTMISLIYDLIDVVGIIIRAPVVAPHTSLIYALTLLKTITGYFGLVGLAIGFYIFIVVWSFRF